MDNGLEIAAKIERKNSDEKVRRNRSSIADAFLISKSDTDETSYDTTHKKMSASNLLVNSVTSPSHSLIDDRSKSTYKESFKVRKETYKKQKKKVVNEFSSAIKDKSVTILSSWLKIRGTLKSWAKYWCVLKPEVMIVYKSSKLHHWVGTILINNCEFIERPSSKEGFCFKIFQPYGQSIWATRGPKGELAGSLVQPMPKDHLIVRAENDEIGRCWLDALEVSQGTSLVNTGEKMQSDIYGLPRKQNDLSLTECGYDDPEDKSDVSSADDVVDDEAFVGSASLNEPIEETAYLPQLENEEFGESGETTEEMEEENKGILWALLKQVRPGMDLSKVTLPTFILEPRSFLDKLSDHYYHSDILAEAAKEENPYYRMKNVVKWYLSGFYKKPKGLKKPYNPIIGELFRCTWSNEKNDSRTFFIAEQVSHYPPVSAFYCTNRKDGYVISGSILARSKFYGNSSSAILDGTGTLTFLKLGEDYTVNMPYAHVKGILIGSLTAEYGGVVSLNCEKTGYNAEIEFKLKPFWKKSDECNHISGKIRMGSSVISKIEGRWDGEIFITEYMKDNQIVDDPLSELYFSPTPEIKQARMKRYTVEYKSQESYESEKLWNKVSKAIKDVDQSVATSEKLALENNQRLLHKELKEKDEQWTPRYFERDPDSTNPHAWIYKFRDLRAWDPGTDFMQFEHKGIIKTQTRHRVPLVKRTTSIINIKSPPLNANERMKTLPSIQEPTDSYGDSRKNSFDGSSVHSTRSEEEVQELSNKLNTNVSVQDALLKALHPIIESNRETQKQLSALRFEVKRMSQNQLDNGFLNVRDCAIIGMVLVFHVFLQWLWKKYDW